MLVSSWAYSSTMKMEAVRSSETSADTQRTTRSYIPEDSTLHNHRCENLKSYIFIYSLLNDAASISDCIVFNGWMTGELEKM
jgi:hypothetical protein